MGHRIGINKTRKMPTHEWDPEQALAEALSERERFLKKYPNYYAFQREIDQILDKAGSSESRMTVLAILVESKLIELHHQLKKLNHILLRVS